MYCYERAHTGSESIYHSCYRGTVLPQLASVRIPFLTPNFRYLPRTLSGPRQVSQTLHTSAYTSHLGRALGPQSKSLTQITLGGQAASSCADTFAHLFRRENTLTHPCGGTFKRTSLPSTILITFPFAKSVTVRKEEGHVKAKAVCLSYIYTLYTALTHSHRGHLTPTPPVSSHSHLRRSPHLPPGNTPNLLKGCRKYHKATDPLTHPPTGSWRPHVSPTSSDFPGDRL